MSTQVTSILKDTPMIMYRAWCHTQLLTKQVQDQLHLFYASNLENSFQKNMAYIVPMHVKPKFTYLLSEKHNEMSLNSYTNAKS